MSIALTITWDPRGELARLQRYWPQLEALYDHLIVILPPGVDGSVREGLSGLSAKVVETQDWPEGRYLCLVEAMQTDASHMQYADADRIIRWIETRPDELANVVQAITQSDCLVLGRTEAAFKSHPKALGETETLCNMVFSWLLGQELDLCAGSKAFSRKAAEFLIKHAAPNFGLGTDTEWIVLLHRGGFQIDMLLVDGLDWETADRYRDMAADPATQSAAAQAFDRECDNWISRVELAQQMMETGLAAMRQNLGEV